MAKSTINGHSNQYPEGCHLRGATSLLHDFASSSLRADVIAFNSAITAAGEAQAWQSAAWKALIFGEPNGERSFAEHWENIIKIFIAWENDLNIAKKNHLGTGRTWASG